MGKVQSFWRFFILIYSIWIVCVICGGNSEEKVERNALRKNLVSRNFTRNSGGSNDKLYRGNARLFGRRENVTGGGVEGVGGDEGEVSDSEVTGDEVETREGERKVSKAPQRIAGVDNGVSKNPQELIRNVLINHTLEHGGEQDLDKLVFSALPQGKKLVFRTVRIIRTDENGDPIDDVEGKQPTYWDVTLANATDPRSEVEQEDLEEEEVEDEEESEEGQVGEEVAATENGNGTTTQGRKKSDLESSETHPQANYYLNGYGGSSQEKHLGKTRYHGNDHGNSHKHTYTVTDGKDVKPYHGTEKGVNDYANEHGKEHKDHGERFKTSKRKNKGRKVSGFKRVYHKEEFQRTEHFFDDEEANKIAESFGLSEAKGGANHGANDDKRKYQKSATMQFRHAVEHKERNRVKKRYPGVHTEYLDGKKHENEHGTRNAYNKGQHTTYGEHERHNHHNKYGKQMSNNHHGGGHYHQNQNQQGQYHPNHNYHGSHSHNAPTTNNLKESVRSLPASVADQIAKFRGRGSIEAVYQAPLANSFSVTEFDTPKLEGVTTTERNVGNGGDEGRGRPYNFKRVPIEDSQGSQINNEGVEEEVVEHRPRRRRPRKRKEHQHHQENKMFFSPKHRPVKEGEKNGERGHLNNFSSYPKDPAPYPTSSSIGGVKENENIGEVITPYAPNFGPKKQLMHNHKHNHNNQDGGGGGMLRPSYGPRQNFRRFPHWMWNRHRFRRPRPENNGVYAHHNEEQHQHPRPTQVSNSPILPSATPSHSVITPLTHLASIPLRHANAYNRLLHRAKVQNYFFQENPGQINYYELSTRKSDIIDDNVDKNRTENDAAHYFNHNHRYAKNHLTSTLQPPVPVLQNGVRNTLLDPNPGHYSTLIKVLPATMLPMNESTSQSKLNEFGGVRNTMISPITLASPTRRPITAAESISITTEFPTAQQQLLVPQYSHIAPQQPHQRPFIPNKNKWLTFSFNLGNPDFKLGNEFGPSQHPFGSNSKRVSKLMQGIKHGLLRPFGGVGRVPLLAQPTANTMPQIMNPIPAHQNSFTVPKLQVPTHLLPYQTQHYHQHLHPYAVPQRPLIPIHVVPHGLPMNLPMAYGPLPLGSKEHPKTLPAPKQSQGQSQRPKFYYDYKPQNKTNPSMKPKEPFLSVNRKGIFKPTLKVSSSKVNSSTITITTTNLPPTDLTSSIKSLNSSETPERREGVASTSASSSSSASPSLTDSEPPFINGIMDSVADFFGKMG